MARVTFKYTSGELEAQKVDDALLLRYQAVLRDPASASATELDKARRFIDGGYARRRKARRDAAQKRADDAKAKRLAKKSNEILADAMRLCGDDPARAHAAIDPLKLVQFSQLSAAPDAPPATKPEPLSPEKLELWAKMKVYLETLPVNEPTRRAARKYVQDRLGVLENAQSKIDGFRVQEITEKVGKLLNEVRLTKPNTATVTALKERFEKLIGEANELAASPHRDENGARMSVVYRAVADFLVETLPELDRLAPKPKPQPEVVPVRQITLAEALDDHDSRRKAIERTEEEHRRQLKALLAGLKTTKEAATALEAQEVQQPDGRKVTTNPFGWLGDRKTKLLDKFEAGNIEDRDLIEFCHDPHLDPEAFVFYGKKRDGTRYQRFGNGVEAVAGTNIFRRGNSKTWFVVPDFAYELADGFADEKPYQQSVPTPSAEQWSEMQRTLRPGCRWTFNSCSGAWIQAEPGEEGDGLQASHVLKPPLAVVWLQGQPEPDDYDPTRYTFFYGKYFAVETENLAANSGI